MAMRAAAAKSIGYVSTAQTPAVRIVQRRGLSGGGDHHEPPRVNIWQDPLSPSKWKEEHFVLASLTGWGLLIYGGMKTFGGGKKEEKIEEVAAK
ncbi:hypothetical protein LUZ60_017453 [Juncus effusus]|nr:hypothetical protein LUZ60_017453 [Juncus effusus]